MSTDFRPSATAVLAQLFVKNIKPIASMSAGFVLLILSRDFYGALGLIVGASGVAMILGSTSREVFSYLQQGISPLFASSEQSSDTDVITRISR
jgi:hypothetical protein